MMRAFFGLLANHENWLFSGLDKFFLLTWWFLLFRRLFSLMFLCSSRYCCVYQLLHSFYFAGAIFSVCQIFSVFSLIITKLAFPKVMSTFLQQLLRYYPCFHPLWRFFHLWRLNIESLVHSLRSWAEQVVVLNLELTSRTCDIFDWRSIIEVGL